MPDSDARPFREVLCAELEEIRQSRETRGIRKPVENDENPFLAAIRSGLVGLSFSGGGIRSATFNLGVLQGLARLKQIPNFDYLSTVSGGGYIGGWLSAWIHHEREREREAAQSEGREVVKGKELVEVAARPRSERSGQPGGAEPPEINFLRQFSNYLTPRRGLFGADTWTVIGIYLRNFFINLTILVLALLALLLVPRLQAFYFEKLANASTADGWHALPWVAALWLAIAFTFVVANLSHMFGDSNGNKEHKYFARTKWTQLLVILPILLSAWFLAAWLWAQRQAFVESWIEWSLYFGAAYMGLWILGWFVGELVKPGILQEDSRLKTDQEPPAIPDPKRRTVRGGFRERFQTSLEAGREYSMQAWRIAGQVGRRMKGVGSRTLTLNFGWVLFAAAVSGIVAGLLLAFLARLLCQWAGMLEAVPECHVANLGFFLVLGVFFVAETLQIAVAGRGFFEDAREWWGRLGGILLLWSLLLAGLFVLVVDGPWWLAKLEAYAAAEGWLEPGLILAWLATTLGGIAAGRSSLTGSPESKLSLELLGKVAPPIFVVGLLLILASLTQNVLPDAITSLHKSSQQKTEGAQTTSQAQRGGSDRQADEPCPRVTVAHETRRESPCKPDATPASDASESAEAYAGFPIFNSPPIDQDRMYWARVQTTLDGHLWLYLVLFLGAALGLSCRAGINDFSMHALYRNRLVRCYLGASRFKEREQHPFTGFDPADDATAVSDLKPSAGYAGPFLIINTALNLVRGSKLAWQQRKAASLVFTPLYSGYEAQEKSEKKLEPYGYRLTERYGDSVSLGTAVAISGAAASPNMGYHSSPALAFLMTVFNVRLGWWIGNPRRRDTWHKPEPALGLFYLIYELLGQTNDRRGYVYLSDGGHFENLGIYELVRRRCRFILACDAAEDHEMKFGDFGAAVEKCRADFGIDIEIDLTPVRREAESGLSNTHCAIGRIRYDQVHPEADQGILVYLKSSLANDDEPVDVHAYKSVHSEFPHEPTSDQWFDEAQFESYRVLGEHIIQRVFDLAENSEKKLPADPAELFTRMQTRWDELARAGNFSY